MAVRPGEVALTQILKSVPRRVKSGEDARKLVDVGAKVADRVSRSDSEDAAQGGGTDGSGESGGSWRRGRRDEADVADDRSTSTSPRAASPKPRKSRLPPVFRLCASSPRSGLWGTARQPSSGARAAAISRMYGCTFPATTPPHNWRMMGGSGIGLRRGRRGHGFGAARRAR